MKKVASAISQYPTCTSASDQMVIRQVIQQVLKWAGDEVAGLYLGWGHVLCDRWEIHFLLNMGSQPSTVGVFLYIWSLSGWWGQWKKEQVLPSSWHMTPVEGPGGGQESPRIQESPFFSLSLPCTETIESLLQMLNVNPVSCYIHFQKQSAGSKCVRGQKFTNVHLNKNASECLRPQNEYMDMLNPPLPVWQGQMYHFYFPWFFFYLLFVFLSSSTTCSSPRKSRKWSNHLLWPHSLLHLLFLSKT